MGCETLVFPSSANGPPTRFVQMAPLRRPKVAGDNPRTSLKTAGGRNFPTRERARAWEVVSEYPLARSSTKTTAEAEYRLRTMVSCSSAPPGSIVTHRHLTQVETAGHAHYLKKGERQSSPSSGCIVCSPPGTAILLTRSSGKIASVPLASFHRISLRA